jgi:ankyrin repeat protein
MIEQFVHYLIIAVFHRPAQVHLFATLIHRLCATLENREICERIRTVILQMFPEKPASSGHFSNANAQVLFLYECYQNGLFGAGDIIGMFDRLTSGSRGHLRRVVLHLLAYFAPVIESDAALAARIWEDLPVSLDENGHGIQHIFMDMFGDLPGLRANNWARLRALRDDVDSVAALLRRDAHDELRALAAHPDFNVDGRIEPSLFEPCFMQSSRPSYLMYAAFYGATRCFNYLSVSGADWRAADDQGHTVVHHAIAGGHVQLVRQCEQQRLSFDGALGLAVRLYRREIFDWLSATRFQFTTARSNEPIVADAARTNNIAMILYSIENKLDLNGGDEDRCGPLWLAALFGYTDVVRLLLAADGTNINPAGPGTPLMIAAHEGHEDTVRVLLGHPRVNIAQTATDGVFLGVFEQCCMQRSTVVIRESSSCFADPAHVLWLPKISEGMPRSIWQSLCSPTQRYTTCLSVL